MPQHNFSLLALLQNFDNHLLLGQALYHPEVDALGVSTSRVVDTLRRDLGKHLEQLDPTQYFQRRGPTEMRISTLPLTLEAPDADVNWRTPVELSLPVLLRQHEESFIALLPTLGIEVVTGSEEDLQKLLPRHARIALLRAKSMSLVQLTQLARVTSIELHRVEVLIEKPTPKQAALAEREQREARESLLDQVCTRLDTMPLAPAHEVQEPLRLLAETLAGRHPRSVLLIGPPGVGKTAIIHELIRRREEFGLSGRSFWATSGARLVAGQSGFGMWQKRCQDLLREAGRHRAILHLGNLIELLEVGKSEHQSQGLASFLRPWLGRGELLAILECTPEQLPLIERQDPQLVRSLMPLRVSEPDRARVETILRRVAATHRDGALLPEGLYELLRLHTRYAAYSANPGRPLRFLRNLLIDLPEGKVIDRATVTGAFSRETGLPLVLLEDAIRLDLDESHDWFASRVIGQQEAVSLIVDLLAMVKAALNRPRKPIASLLFIGPTGVGKTEMAKALAEFLFGSRDRLTRFDMSEYADPLAIQRLIGGMGSSEGLLTARIREQPFSVILLDEIEKAHSQLFDLLLQVLGEGRLTDASGRLADFSNCVVIMTSNLGAESYLQGDFGLLPGQPTATRAREHFTREVEKSLRPELVNRIDRIVPFSPLDPVITRRIAERQIALLRRRDGILFRGATLEVADDLVDWLTRKGYDPRYGARPLKRTIERHLLAPLAIQMNDYTADTAIRISLGIDKDAPRIHVRARTDESGQQIAVGGTGQAQAWFAEQAVAQRRSWQRLSACPAMLEVTNEIFLAERTKKPEKRFDPKLATLTRLRDDIAAGLTGAIQREDRLLVQLHSGHMAEVDSETERQELDDDQARFHQLLLAVFLRRFEQSDHVTLAIFSEEQDTLFELAQAYYRVACANRSRVLVWQFAASSDPEFGPQRRLLQKEQEAFSDKESIAVNLWNPKRKAFEKEVVQVSPTKGVIGWGLEIVGPAVVPRFTSEEGLHVLQLARRTSKALVVAGPCSGQELTLPDGIDRLGTIGSQSRRRLYRLDQPAVEDSRLGWRPQPDRDLSRVLDRCIEETLRSLAAEVLES